MQKVNYQLMTDAVLSGIEGTAPPRLLLHACCAPCASYVLEYLTPYFDIDVFFYNPNIYPSKEYEKRLSELYRLVELLPHTNRIGVIEGKYEHDRYTSFVKGLEGEPEGGSRCEVCLGMRVGETARLAAEERYDFFTTTLTVSPHKNVEKLNVLGYAAAEKYGTMWLPSDFKKRNGYLRTVQLCREYGIYRQNYCGCTPQEAVMSESNI